MIKSFSQFINETESGAAALDDTAFFKKAWALITGNMKACEKFFADKANRDTVAYTLYEAKKFGTPIEAKDYAYFGQRMKNEPKALELIEMLSVGN